jgi:hypothetical protein
MTGPKGLGVTVREGAVDSVSCKWTDDGTTSSWSSYNQNGNGLDTNRYKLMQFIGLQDKNKADIYEGDILEGHSDGLATVVWRAGETQFDFADGGNIGIWEMRPQKAAIVGNIFENPELLEKATAQNA